MEHVHVRCTTDLLLRPRKEMVLIVLMRGEGRQSRMHTPIIAYDAHSVNVYTRPSAMKCRANRHVL